MIASVNITGIDATVARQIKENIDYADEMFSELAGYCEAQAKATAAFVDRSGRLRRSIKKYKSKYENGGYIVLANAPHAHLLEMGHLKVLWGKRTGERVPPKSFMRVAKAKTLIYARKKIRSATR